MARIASLIVGAGLLALQGCSAAPIDEDVTAAQSAVTPSGSATLTVTSDGGSWYCAHVYMQNALSVATTRWQVVIDLRTTQISGNWSVNFSGTQGVITATPVSYNTSIAPGATTEFMFCANKTPGATLPTIKAYNMEMNLFTACQSNNGVNPAKAALAVAMATELGRWEPDLDLTVSNGKVVLSSTAVCIKNSCKNTKALLGQQDYTPDQTVFNNTNYSQELQSSFQRQRDLINNLKANSPSQVPISNYKLTLIGGPVNLGYGNCGPHYIYQVDYSSGTNAGKPLSTTDAANLANTLCFYGQGNCGNNNPYVGLITTNVPGCPSGKTCIAIDPTDGDNGSTATTTAGSAPTYPMNRVYDPNGTLLGSACITTRGVLASLQSKCSTSPTTCGYDYCM